jgi:class 3 adenylate cyclase
MNKEELLNLYPWPESFEINSQKVIDTFAKVPLKSPSKEIWKWLSDSSRINRALGMGERLENEKDGQLIVRTKMLGIVQEWIEYPWNWVEGESIIVDRRYNCGFAQLNHSIFYFKDNNLYIYMGFTPSNTLSSILLTAGVKSVVDNLANLLSEIDSELTAGKAIPSYFSHQVDSLSDLQKDLLHERLDKCKKLGMSEQSISKIYDLICLGDELELYRIRVKELSTKWGIDNRTLLKDFLIATKANIFNISWDIICPSCLGPRSELSLLVDLLNVDHCETCRLKFETDGENSIEVTFKINPQIRKVRKIQFCAAEPARKKHIKLQWTLDKNLSDYKIELDSGNYRLRVIGDDVLYSLSVQEDGDKLLKLSRGESQVVVSNRFKLSIPEEFNNGVLIIEEEQVDPFALRPRDVFAISDFKKLFNNERLGQGIQLYLGEQTILFTDIVSSTKYYEKFGDKHAFEEIKKHFEEVYEIFEQNNGVIVKTIGDAVMASFPSPDDALKACEQANRVFDRNHSKYNFLLRMSSHVGKVIGVNSDTGIDYFGNTVNVAAKLQNIADDHQFGISSDFFSRLSDKDLNSWEISRQKINIAGKVDEVETVTLTFKESKC